LVQEGKTLDDDGEPFLPDPWMTWGDDEESESDEDADDAENEPDAN
jgi:hypothetical protein